MIPRFRLVRATTLAEALEAHQAAGDAAYLAGGTELLQIMKMGLAQVGALIDLKGLPELRGIALETDGSLRIGALTTHRELERSPLVRGACPALARLEGRVANVRVRNTGTLGGNLAFAEPHSDPAVFLVACGAEIDLVGPTGRRTMPLEDFIVGPLATARDPSEVVDAIRLPAARAGTRRAYEKIAFFERPAVSLAVELVVDGEHIDEAVVVLGSATERPTRVSSTASELVGRSIADAVASAREIGFETFGGVDFVDDLNGRADYKRHLAGVLLERAVRAALIDAEGDGHA
jgi:carbon-monoxide dehydrogenase medium subunit